MTETPHFALPLLAAAQAQKHVTVNEALMRLDALAAMRLMSLDLTDAPASPGDGEAYVVASGATGTWTGHDGQLALWSNGDWMFLVPEPGWRVTDRSTGRLVLFDGADWIVDGHISSPGGAATLMRLVEVDHTLTAGATSVVAGAIPAATQVLGVTARVITAISGSATGWSLGVAGSTNRYGSGLGLGLNSYASGLTGSPLSYYSDTDLVISAEGGSFSTGAVRLAVHLVALQPPRSV
ncbi:MAG: DUF2793 domain-containing protein [Pseudomonadota bacterium]